jgi:hypothetical protein
MSINTPSKDTEYRTCKISFDSIVKKGLNQDVRGVFLRKVNNVLYQTSDFIYVFTARCLYWTIQGQSFWFCKPTLSILHLPFPQMFFIQNLSVNILACFLENSIYNLYTFQFIVVQGHQQQEILYSIYLLKATMF